MPITFSKKEEHVRSLFNNGSQFCYKGKDCVVDFAAKPTSTSIGGEPKTDIFVAAKNVNTGSIFQIKISFKKGNADFLENKMKAERAEQIFGPSWQEIIKDYILQITDKFEEKKLIYKKNSGHTEEGSITLGWRFEITNKSGGVLSGELDLTQSQLMDVYAGINLDSTKKMPR